MAGLLLGEDQLTIGKDVEDAAATEAELHFFHARLLLQFALQAPGLLANVGSKETAFDLDFHGSTLMV
jgi:hypothetical protein